VVAQRTFTADEDAYLLKHGAAKAAEKLGRSLHSTEGRLRRLKRAASLPASVEREAMRQSGENAEIARLRRELERAQAGGERLPVACAAAPPVPIADRWRRQEQVNADKIEDFNQRSKFSLKLEDKPVGIAFVSDQHINAGNIDLRRMREDAELIASTPGLYAMLGGDSVDNHVKHRSAMIAQEMRPKEQWEFFEHYLSIFADKIVCLINGNHDHWDYQFVGVDMVARIARDHHLCYAPHEARVKLTVGDCPYDVAIRHQYRFNSSFNLTHSVKQFFRMGPATFDVGVLCHLHESALEAFRSHGLIRWACRPGSYKIQDDYGNQYGFNAARPSCPTAIFFPGERRIIGFHDLRDAVLMLKAIR
jgi:hypothetical protein